MWILYSVFKADNLLFDYGYKGDAMKNNILKLTRALTMFIAVLLVSSVWGFTTDQDSEITGNKNLTVTGALKIGSVVDTDAAAAKATSADGIVTSTETIAENATRENTIPTTKAVKEYVDSVNPVYGLLVKSNFGAIASGNEDGILTLNLNPGIADLLLSEKVTISSDDEVQVTGLSPSETYRVTVAIDFGNNNSNESNYGYRTTAIKTGYECSDGLTSDAKIAESRNFIRDSDIYQRIPTDILTFDTEETKFTLCVFRPEYSNEDTDIDNSSSLLVAIYEKPTT